MGVYKYDGSDFHPVTISGTDVHYVKAIYEDKDHNLWFGTENGLFKYTEENFWHFTEENGLVDNHIKCVEEDNDGNIWFGCENGISKYDGTGFKNFNMKKCNWLKENTGHLEERKNDTRINSFLSCFSKGLWIYFWRSYALDQRAFL